MSFSFCYTWTDLDKNHFLRLENKTALSKEYPKNLINGAVLKIETVTSEDVTVYNILGSRQDFKIERKDVVDNFSWKYGNK